MSILKASITTVQTTKNEVYTMRKRTGILIAGMTAMVLLASMVSAYEAYDAGVNGSLTNYTKSYSSTSVDAIGGNITRMNVTMEKQTSHWGGFFGNVTHSLLLDAAGSTFYNWANAIDSTGVVIFANSTNVNWDNLLGATETYREEEDTALNLTGERDSVNSTFTDTNSAEINISGNTISPGSASAVNTQSEGGNPWETSLIRSTSTSAKLYASVIQQNNQNYAGNPVDYQAMVPVTSGSNNARTYYLYAALG